MIVAWNVFASWDLTMWTQQMISGFQLKTRAGFPAWAITYLSQECVWFGTVFFFSGCLWRCIFISNEKQCNGRSKIMCEKIHSVSVQLKCLVYAHFCVTPAQLIVTSRISKTTSVRFGLDRYNALEIIYFTLSSHKNSHKIPAACSSVASGVAEHEFLQSGSL